MSTVDYIPFATGGGASVMDQATYATDAPTGVVPGLADPTFANKSWRQSSMIAAAVANFISAQLGINVLDDGNITNLISELTSAIQLGGASGLSLGMGVPQNLRLAASVGSNNLTITVQGTNGSNPSATNPVTIPFRDPTIATGDVIARTVTAALSFTINSGNTMGVPANNQAFRLWVVAFDNGGTVALGAINCCSGAAAGPVIFPIDESTPQTSQSGTNGGSTAGLYYANVSAITAKSIRILGYLEWSSGLVTAGTWAAIPTKIQLYGPGQYKPGQEVQRQFNFTGALASGTTVMPNDDTIPQSTEGDQYMSQAITPTFQGNVLQIEHVGNYGNGSVAYIGVALFQDSTANALATSYFVPAGISQGNWVIPLGWQMLAATVVATTFKVRAGSTSGTVAFNGTSTGPARRFGGSLSSFLSIREIMA